MSYRNRKRVIIIDQQGEVLIRWCFEFFQCIHQNGHFAWECLLHTFPDSWESKVMMPKTPQIKQEVRKRIFSFPHFFSFKCFSSLLFRKAWLKNKSWFLPEQYCKRKRDDIFPQRLKWLGLECYVSCNGDIFFLWLFLQTLFFISIVLKNTKQPWSEIMRLNVFWQLSLSLSASCNQLPTFSSAIYWVFRNKDEFYNVKTPNQLIIFF